MDLSRRNNLLYFRDSKTGSLDMTGLDPKHLEALLSGEKVSITALRPDMPANEARDRIAGVFKRTLLNLEEKGLQTLYVALGMAAWPAEDRGRPARSAVVLLPVKLDAKGLPPTVQRAGPPQINLALLHVLESEFGCAVSAEALLAGLFDERVDERVDARDPAEANANAQAEAEEIPGPLTDLATTFNRLRDAARRIEGFKVEDAAVLSNFSFQKMAMVRDIQSYAAQIASHRVLAAMAGDLPARVALQKDHQDISFDELDATPPDQEFMVLDADSSQQRVIASVARLQDGVIQGPPGTGKSQTIVNLIATLAAQGKRVLFVAEKRAALQVVYDRLKRVGLDHLVLDLHGADVSSRQIYEHITTALSAMRDVPAVNAAPQHQQFDNRRGKLNAHVDVLHHSHQPLGLSAYHLQGNLIHLPPQAASPVRFRGDDLDRLTPEAVRHIRDLLAEASGFAGLLLETDPSPWTKATISNGAELGQATDLVNALHADLLPRLKQALDGICEQVTLKRPTNIKDVVTLSALLDEVGEAFARYNPAIFEQPLAEFAAELEPVTNGAKRLLAKLTRSGYRRAVQTLRAMRLAPADEAQLRIDALKLRDVLSGWRALSDHASQTSLPQQLAEQQALHACVAELAPMRELQRYLPNVQVPTMPLDALEAAIAALANDVNSPRQLLRVRQLQRELGQYKLAPLLAMFAKTSLPAGNWGDAFDFALWRSHLDRIWAQVPALSAFRGEAHQKIVDEFKQLDQTRTTLAVQRVKRAQAELALRARNAFPEENILVKSQIQRKRRRLPLRDLLAQAPNVLTAIFPCWMASPLSISQLLKADRRYFDIVIFDEASQILPEDAVPAIMRAEHVVVAGDRNQLPPTTFFASGAGDDESDDDDNAVDGYESVLDLMTGISDAWSLDWHYRSKDESLIAFSNRHIYQDQMITFPGATTGSAISHVLVDDPLPGDGEIQSVSAEVNRVADLVLEHARTRPHETLGVITMGIAHADRIQKVLDTRLAEHPELEAFFDLNLPERFFVKNLERVQGDERDAIIISIGYGKDSSGRLPYRFGPLLTQGGERRLNVAVTRARSRLTLVSSFSHHDMDPSRTKARGVELLRLYLEYAASHGRTLSRSANGHGQPENPFEADVYRALRAEGLQLIPQWGVSSYRIDFAVQHPDEPGRFVLAIECDGATYHSAPTARDRDRLRQQVLTSLGWRFHRIWSTDWFNNREAEIRRTVAAYREALAADVQPKLPVHEPQIPAAVETVAFAKTPPAAIEMAPLKRRPKMIQPDGRPIDQYTSAELVSIVRWVQSDGKLRDDDEMFDEVYQELGYKKRGTRITQRVRAAIEQAKLQKGTAI